MRRIRGFRIITLEFGRWNIRTKSGQWQLLPDMIPRDAAIETSWHRTWNQAVATYSSVFRSGSTEEVVIVSTSKKIVLAVIGRVALEEQFSDSDGEPLWKSTLLRSPKLNDSDSTGKTPVFFNYNQKEVAWIAMTGAEKEVPCSLSFLEVRARKNPDGIYGRLVARRDELRDYFRSG